MTWLLPTYAFTIGAIVGSFLNVVIHRYPREESVVFPPSRCPECGARIRPWDNVPILSYLLLLGRCRSCRTTISPRYPLVELANGLFFLAIYFHTGPSWMFFPIAAIVSMTIALIYIDLEIQILPDVIDLPAAAIGLVIGAFRFAELFPALVLSESIADSLYGIVIGAGSLYLLAFLYKAIRKTEGMGLGDVKMMAMIGATLGWRPLGPVVVIASVTATLVALPFLIRSRRNLALPLPFGVFLGLATLAVLFFGHQLMDLWLRLLIGDMDAAF